MRLCVPVVSTPFAQRVDGQSKCLPEFRRYQKLSSTRTTHSLWRDFHACSPIPANIFLS
jgi:hypothetical protein